jgi:hypothetical protein
MRHLRFAVLAVVAVALCAAPVAVAHPPHNDGGAVVAPVHKVAGLTGGELLGEAWAQILSHPADTFSGSCMPLGRNGKVVSPEPGPDFTATCTVKRGTSLFFWFGSECSNVEEPPFFGADEAEQRACAVAADVPFFEEAHLTVDGGEPVDILNPRFELFSPQRTVDLPADNNLGVEPQTATFTAHGWGALVRKLRPGQHTITVEVATADEDTTFTVTVNVVRGHHPHGGHDLD